MNKLILIGLCGAFLATNSYAASVNSVGPDKLPAMVDGLTMLSPYTSGPSPLIKQKIRVDNYLQKLVPEGWKVNCDSTIVKIKHKVNTNPQNSWIKELDLWLKKTHYRALINARDHEIFVRQGVGGYKYESGKPWKEDPNTFVWSIQGGQPLKVQLTNWAKLAGYTLFWEAPNDFKMRGSLTVEGTFESAIQQLFDIMYHNGEMSLKATIYRGNNVIRVRQD